MTPITSARRRAEEFAAVLDGRSVASEHNRAFVELVARLETVESPAIRPEFSAELRAQLMAEAPQALPTAGLAKVILFAPESKRRRMLSVAAASCIVVGSGLGVAAASQQALPGDPLYPVKRGIERIELATSSSSVDRGEVLLEQAANRLDEVRSLALNQSRDPATPDLITQTLDDFIVSATDGGGSMVDAYRNDSDQNAIAELRQFTDHSAQSLDQLTGIVGSDARDELIVAAEVLSGLDEAARLACPICSSLPPLMLSDDMIALKNLATIVSPTGTEVTPGTSPSQPAEQPAGHQTQAPAGATTIEVQPTESAPSTTLYQATDTGDNPITAQPPAEITSAPNLPTGGIVTALPKTNIDGLGVGSTLLPEVTILPTDPLLPGLTLP